MQNINKDREPFIDNLKFILICTVVIGHFVEPYIFQAVFFKAVFVCIYSFHMPMFVFISGYLSKSDSSTSAHKITTNLLIPYIIFSLIWRLRDNIHTGGVDFDILSPTFHLWYLLSLFSWKLLLPVIKTVKHYVIISFIISLIIGFSPLIGNPMSLSRTLGLLPFFLLGSICPLSNLNAIHQRKYLAIPGIILLGVIAYAVIRYTSAWWRIISWAEPYHVAGYSNRVGFFMRIELMVAAILIGLLIVVITPLKKTFFTSLGSRTLTVYILHGFLVKSFAIRFPLWNQSLLNNIIIILFPVFIIFLLSLPIVESFYRITIGGFSEKLAK
jgi:fucose 4-O-acetylase-like acetyltransferase